MVSKAPSTTAWTAPPVPIVSRNGNQAPIKANVDLLDTYEPSKNTATPSSNSESEQVSEDWQKIASSVSEEEQLRMISESENWETVKDKKNKKGKVVQAPSQKENKKPVESGKVTYEEGTPRTPIPPTGPGQEWVMTLEKRVDENGGKVDYKKDLQDSEWDVAGYDQ